MRQINVIKQLPTIRDNTEMSYQLVIYTSIRCAYCLDMFKAMYIVVSFMLHCYDDIQCFSLKSIDPQRIYILELKCTSVQIYRSCLYQGKKCELCFKEFTKGKVVNINTVIERICMLAEILIIDNIQAFIY